ncbi:hypothetical protein pZL12.98 [Streptomyces phage ZL12]|uniref:Uncharacterized protein n=1 Tax=Streptomyces phage ZL12 TaxID=2570911 RepID=D0UWK3_9CAUD|nr:hypothetical protein QEH43_gp098 [Streptomyces phage ZL12]ACX71175.1 hypothetical protein pZL12.98 [Streptomyces phage ZL12]
MTTQPERLHHLLDRLLRGVLLPEEREQLAGLVRAQEERLNDWKQAAGAGMTLADNLRGEIHALALGVPLVCSDDRHKTQVLSQAIRIRELEADNARLAVGQCLDSRAMCEQHHAPPVAGCPYPRCRAATAPAPRHDEGATST